MNKNPSKNQKRSNKSQIDRFVTSPNMGDIIRKRMTIANGSIATTAGGIIALATFSSALVQSAPASEWASFAARYQQFRVLAMRFKGEPSLKVNAVNTATNHLLLAVYSGDFIGTQVPATAAQVFSDENAKQTSAGNELIITASAQRNPNAMLWNPTNAALPAANAIGVALASNTTAIGPGSLSAFQYVLEFQVEFRGSQ